MLEEMQPRTMSIRSALGALLSMPCAFPACSSHYDEGDRDGASRDIAAPDASRSGGDAPAEACPAAVPGTSVRALEIERGAALEITTTGDVAAVRKRARVMAEHHGIALEDHVLMHRDAGPDAAGHDPSLMGGEPGTDRAPNASRTEGIASLSASVEDIEAGARVLLVPREGSDRDTVEAVRAHARRVAARMSEGVCPVMMT